MGKTMAHLDWMRIGLVLMKLLISIVFVGWMMMLVVMPTNVYWKSWWPVLQSKTGSTTYFGKQGNNLLIFTFPIMFIAVLGCVYLHLAKRSEPGVQSRRLEAWRKPVIVRGPLGVLSGVEAAFCLMFVALLVWSLWVYLANSFSSIKSHPHSAVGDGEKVWQAKLENAAWELGMVGNICCAFLFFPVTRGSSLLPLVGLTAEASIKYHVWMGHIVMTLFTAHGICYIIFWVSRGQNSEMNKWASTGVSNVAGELSLLFGLIMWATTFPRIRRKFFELFFYTHQLYILFLVFFVLHVGVSNFYYILPGVYLFMVDRFLRFLQSRSRVRVLSARLLPSETIELNFAKSPGFSYTPMSSVFINVPSISSLQWHPFTVSSSSSLEPEKLSIIIKKEGSWTQKLYQTLASPSRVHLNVSIEGPYGPASVDLVRYDSLILVSGGSGISPFISIIRELIHKSNVLNSPTPNILLICSFKTSADLTMLDLLLPVSGFNVSNLSHLQLRVEAFVTRERGPTTASQKRIQTLWFKPNPTDVPITPVLGQNSWLWLGAIISTSFIGYLLIIGIVNRYYIYPIDKNNNIYPYTSKSLINLLFICTSIAVTASIAFLWNKKSSTPKDKQVQIMDVATPGVSLSSLFYNTDRELESVPNESLVQVTKVHYGGRPNLKKMLLESDGSSTGVMASGPREMRHEVANICSSSLVKNLYFESISFSW